MPTTKTLLIAGLMAATGMAVMALQKPIKTLNFDSDKPGQIAPSFKQETGVWKVVADETAPSKPNVLAQLAAGGEKDFNIALLEEAAAKNIDLQASFRIAGGKIDQGVGLVCRVKDAKNYYLFRYNPIERNIHVYKVIDGARIIIHSIQDIDEVAGWQTIRIVTNGTRLEGHLNGEARFSIINEAISDPGKVGLWTNADAQTHFDDVKLEVMDR